MTRNTKALLALLGMVVTIDLLNWSNHSIGNSSTVAIAAGVSIAAAYRLGQWTVRGDRT